VPTTTLATTALSVGVNASDTRIKVDSTSGMNRDTRLYFPGELMQVIRLDVSPWVIVRRGVDGTTACPHSTAETIYIGRADQFYQGPPVGRPEGAVLVSPYIDVIGNKVYFAQGDTTPSGTAVRWWQEQTTTRVIGPLGSTTTTLNPTSST
jgi:hypothetical protein